MKASVSLKCFVTGYLWKLFFDCNLSQTPSKLISLTFLKFLELSCSKLEQLSSKKGQKSVLLGNCFSNVFTDVEIRC